MMRSQSGLARQIVAVAAIVGTVFVGTPPLLASPSGVPATVRSAKRASVALFDRNGNLTAHSEGDQLNFIPMLRIVRGMKADKVTLAKWRATAEDYSKRSPKGLAAVAKTLALIDALAAQTREQFHERVSKLGVDVVKSRVQADGVLGIETRFIVGDKIRARYFRADTIAIDEEPPGGPLVADATPNVSPMDDCDGEPCATEQDIADATAAILAINEEAENLEYDINAEWADYESYCSQNPYDCEGGDSAMDAGGPSVASDADTIPCLNEMANFGGALVSTYASAGGALIALSLAASAPIALAIVTVSVFAVAGGLLWAYSAGNEVIACKANRIK